MWRVHWLHQNVHNYVSQKSQIRMQLKGWEYTEQANLMRRPKVKNPHIQSSLGADTSRVFDSAFKDAVMEVYKI